MVAHCALIFLPFSSHVQENILPEKWQRRNDKLHRIGFYASEKHKRTYYHYYYYYCLQVGRSCHYDTIQVHTYYQYIITYTQTCSTYSDTVMRPRAAASVVSRIMYCIFVLPSGNRILKCQHLPSWKLQFPPTPSHIVGHQSFKPRVLESISGDLPLTE